MKKKILPIVFILVLVCSSGFFLQRNFDSFKKKAYVYILDCNIFSASRVLIFSVNGGQCEFLKDGSYILALKEEEISNYSINHISPNNVPLWKKNYVNHHMISLSRDQKLIYFFSVDLKPFRGKLTKFDSVIALDVETGKEMARWSIYDIKDRLEKEFSKPVPSATNILPDHQYPSVGVYEDEFSHMNSINIVPENTSSAEIIVNTGRGLELFFTRDLKLIEVYWVDPLWLANSHDAQITQQGDLLLYKNWDEKEKGSLLEKYDLATKKRIWFYDRDPDGKSFSSNKYGSVQMLEDGSFLYSDMDKGGHFTEVGVHGEKLVDFYFPVKDPRTNLPVTFLKTRKVDYTNLSNKIQELVDPDLDQFLLSKVYKRFL